MKKYPSTPRVLKARHKAKQHNRRRREFMATDQEHQILKTTLGVLRQQQSEDDAIN